MDPPRRRAASSGPSICPGTATRRPSCSTRSLPCFFYLTPRSLSFSEVPMISLAAMFFSSPEEDWKQKNRHCLSFLSTAHCVISKVSKFRAPCRGREFSGSAVLSRWMWSASVTLSRRCLRVFYGPKCPQCPPLERTEDTAQGHFLLVFPSPTLFLLLLKNRDKQNE